MSESSNPSVAGWGSRVFVASGIAANLFYLSYYLAWVEETRPAAILFSDSPLGLKASAFFAMVGHMVLISIFPFIFVGLARATGNIGMRQILLAFIAMDILAISLLSGWRSRQRSRNNQG